MRWPDQRAVQSRKWQLIGKSQWCCSANCGHPIARVNVQLDPRYAASKHTTAPINLTRRSPRKHTPDVTTRARKQTSDYSYYSIYRPRKDKRLSRPWWLVAYWNNVPPPGVEPVHVTHSSTNRAPRNAVTTTPRRQPHESAQKRLLNQPSQLCIAHPCDRVHNTPTDRPTDHATYDICNNRPHLCTVACRRCIIIIKSNKLTLYGIGGRLLLTAKFKVTWHKN